MGLIKLPSLRKFWRSKYFIAILFFFVWILFCDNMDLITVTSHRMKLNQLEDEKTWYNEEIARDKQSLEELTTNPQMLEKFAREQYRMKRENEDIFVLVPAKKK